MNVNRDNYEEYFLLYADNELSAEAKNMVETFVKENTELEEEFIMLQQSVLRPDTVLLPNKSSLFKQPDFINESNYQEKFLLYRDNELTLSEIEETEKFVIANPSLQDDFNLLQQVKYQPDNAIVFPDRSLLYKKEEKARVVPFNWRYLAAAVLLGLGLWTGEIYLQNDEPKVIVVYNDTDVPKKNTKNQPKNTETVVVKDNQAEPLKTTDPKQEKDLDRIETNDQQTVRSDQTQTVNKTVLPSLSTRSIEESLAVNDRPVKTEMVKPSKVLVQPMNIISDSNNKPVETIVQPVTNYAQPASFIEEEVKSEDYIFYNITAEEFRKSKVGTFLKKVKRTVERKLPIKVNGLRIGTVEISKEEN